MHAPVEHILAKRKDYFGGPVFSKEELKEFAVKYGKKWLFPDFTNKLTWLVAGIGGVILLTPTTIKQLIFNWIIQAINLNSKNSIDFPELHESFPDYWVGLLLIFFALSHNIANRYFLYKDSVAKIRDSASVDDVDRQLFLRFLEDLPSDSRSIALLKEHDFGSSFHDSSTDKLDDFVNDWNTAEREFLDQELEAKRKELWLKCHDFLGTLSLSSYYINGGQILSCIPDAYRGGEDWPEHVDRKIRQLNTMSNECFRLHRDFVLYGRRKFRC